MYQRRKENINMPRPHQQPKLLRDYVFVRKIDAHILARHRKDDEQQNAEDEVKPFHGDCYNNTAELKCFDTKSL